MPSYGGTMRKKADKESILNDWASGMTSAEIAAAYGVYRGHVCNIILRARDVRTNELPNGDPRAVKRPRGPRKKQKENV
jgi:hypothetical protein